jgi:hypothetical protein
MPRKRNPSTIDFTVESDTCEENLENIGQLVDEPTNTDLEYSSRLEAQRVTVGFRAPLTAQVPQADVADLPLFGGERQAELFG